MRESSNSTRAKRNTRHTLTCTHYQQQHKRLFSLLCTPVPHKRLHTCVRMNSPIPFSAFRSAEGIATITPPPRPPLFRLGLRLVPLLPPSPWPPPGLSIGGGIFNQSDQMKSNEIKPNGIKWNQMESKIKPNEKKPSEMKRNETKIKSKEKKRNQSESKAKIKAKRSQMEPNGAK